jgi:hypothetical protein
VRWYVARALGEETAISVRPLPMPTNRPIRIAGLTALVAVSVGISACGGGQPRQDASEPSGNFPIAVNEARFPPNQRLADTVDLRLEIQNTGNEQVPNLAVTIYTGDTLGGGSFSVRSDQPGLADPNRPVWILESGFPKLASPDEGAAALDAAPTAGASAAQTDTFAFGPLDGGETKDIVWRVTPVVAGTYTVHYELAAGLNGKAKAVGEDGSPVQGEFVVTISAKAPQATVDGSGNVQIQP